MASDSPEAVMRQFSQHVVARDLHALAELYEADALFVAADGRHARGRGAITEALRGLLSLAPQLELDLAEAHATGDLAFVANRWTLRATAPDGSPVEQRGQSAIVLRRQPTGGWRIVIDRP